jgi:CRP/FNR family transcriptional regulator, cyclic AMP receptor protein
MTEITPAELIEAWQKNGESARYQAGEVIFQAGDQGSTLYGILEGSVDLQRDGRTVETLTAGDAFGEGAIVQPNHQRFTTAIARTDCTLATLNRERFLFALQSSPVFAIDIIRSLSNRLRHLKAP